jgi:hypothetical protein
VCAAFAAALARFGVPGEVLTDGKQFTGRFTKPRPGEVLFERICRENGITARNTKPRSPTTTGKVERFHQSLEDECTTGQVFADLEAAQKAVDAFVDEYNHDRPHQGIDDAFPADRFHRSVPERDEQEQHAPPLRLPSGLLPDPVVPEQREADTPHEPGTVSTGRCQPVAVDRVVPASGNLMVARQQIWLGPTKAGMAVTVSVDTDRLHVLTPTGARIKTTASRLSQRDLARLLAEGGRPAGPSPLPASQPELPAVEVDRVVNACGGISIGGRQVSVGMPLAGQRVRVRLDGVLMHVIDEAGQLRRTTAVPAGARAVWTYPRCPARQRHTRPGGLRRWRGADRVDQRQHPGRRATHPGRRRARPQARHRRSRRAHRHGLRQRHRDPGRTETQHHGRQPHQGQTPGSTRRLTDPALRPTTRHSGHRARRASH